MPVAVVSDQAPRLVRGAAPQAIPAALNRLHPFGFVPERYARLPVKVRFFLQTAGIRCDNSGILEQRQHVEEPDRINRLDPLHSLGDPELSKQLASPGMKGDYHANLSSQFRECGEDRGQPFRVVRIFGPVNGCQDIIRTCYLQLFQNGDPLRGPGREAYSCSRPGEWNSSSRFRTASADRWNCKH